jgi:aspartyl-tRNA synthetase
MAFIEGWLVYTYQRVMEKHGDEIFARFGEMIQPPVVPFPRVAMAEALELLKAQGYAPPADKKGDIDPAGERLLGQYVKARYNHDFVFLTDWPVSARPFYHMRYADRPTVTKSFDLIARGLEIITGAQREHRFEILKRQALEKGLTLGPISFYLDFFRYGCPPHGGYALGLGRFLMILMGIQNIRETVYLFRGPTRLQP